jgi:carboxyl-terminal processing protease
MSNKNHSYTPFIAAVCVVVGIVIGTFYANHFSGNKLNIITTSGNKLNYLLHIIDDQYVDTVDMSELVEDAMPAILSELDPHSAYISAKDVEAANEDLKGSFSGIGVRFSMLEDTIHIGNVIKGGPSEKAGILAGDLIITVDGKKVAGVGLSSDEVMKRLKGQENTKVKLGIKRVGEKELKEITVVRGNIAVKSIEASYILNENTGYIKIKNFGEETYPEMIQALAALNQKGMKSLIIDLRDNGGGYMEKAILMVNEFLPKNRLIVYTEGRKSQRQEFISDGHGSYQDIPLVVLVNENSASASEIFAGAIQDNDRGIIVGRRSFGKGLVQQPIEFRDGSLIRLTIARYYTPSGRCIQKPYEKGKEEDYSMDIRNRYKNGEFFSEDSIKQTGRKFHTHLGRTVYGGGGITPDIFVPEDTTNVTSYYLMAAPYSATFALKFIDANRKDLSLCKTPTEVELYLNKQRVLEQFYTFCESKGVRRRNLMIQKSHDLLERIVYNAVVYLYMNDNEYYEYINRYDATVLKALEQIKEGKTFPTLSKKEKK